MACKWPDPALLSLVPLTIVNVGGVVVAHWREIGDEPEPLTCAVAVVNRVDWEPKSSVPHVAPPTGVLPLSEQAPASVIVALMIPFTLTACAGIDRQQIPKIPKTPVSTEDFTSLTFMIPILSRVE